MPMNIVIQEQRKLLGLTQEQVADYLGVSTPAVSKWEKGITSPDIGLLPPLARLLKIDLNTLFSFSENLSAQEIGLFCNELAKQAREDILSAFDAAEAKMHDYPHNEQLLLNVTIILDSLLLQTVDDTLPIDSLDAKISDWYLQLAESNDDKIRNSANYMRVSRYIRQGNTGDGAVGLRGGKVPDILEAAVDRLALSQVPTATLHVLRGIHIVGGITDQRVIERSINQSRVFLDLILIEQDAAREP